MQKDEVIENHWHPYTHDMIVQSGKVAVVIDGVSAVAKAGDRVTFPARLWHSITALQNGVVVDLLHSDADIAAAEANGESPTYHH